MLQEAITNTHETNGKTKNLRKSARYKEVKILELKNIIIKVK